MSARIFPIVQDTTGASPTRFMHMSAEPDQEVELA
jgi:hypothetical protein